MENFVRNVFHSAL